MLFDICNFSNITNFFKVINLDNNNKSGLINFKCFNTLFLFQRLILKRFLSSSLFSFFFYFSKRIGNIFFKKKKYFITFFNKDLFYWSKIYLTREKYEPTSLVRGYNIKESDNFLYVTIWYYH